MAAASTAFADSAAPHIVVARVLKAPQDLVFSAFTDPAHISNWWGPRGFTTTTKHYDLRPGGTWEHTMVGPDGTEYPNLTEFIEVDPPTRLVYRVSDGDDTDDGVVFTATVTFSPVEGGTRVEMRSTFSSSEARDRVIRDFGALQGAIETLDRFEEHLAETAAAEADRHQLVITRAFKAPRELVWKAFTEPERLARWWAPGDWTVPVCNVDLRPGGTWHYCMRGPDGTEAWGKATYDAIQPPALLSYTDAFSDAEGNVNPDLPVSRVIVAFIEHQGATTITFRSYFASAAERQAVIEMGMIEGLGMGFDKLEQLLASAA